MNLEDRLMEIEIRLARQDDTVDTLNKLVFRQQQKIDELESLCSALALRIREMRESSTDEMPADERPPHY
jgi:SlyX protein